MHFIGLSAAKLKSTRFLCVRASPSFSFERAGHTGESKTDQIVGKSIGNLINIQHADTKLRRI